MSYNSHTRRDLTIINITDDKCLVMACDSCGGIGEKTNDTLKASTKIVGSYTARVPIMEVLCSGATVVSISNTVCCEMRPTAQLIIDGINDEMQAAGLENIILNGSTEENFLTTMTAMGICVTGIADKAKLKFNKSFSGDIVILLGYPLVGDELLTDGGKSIAIYDDLYRLLQNDSVREIVPVGSKGILYETQNLASLNNLQFKSNNSKINLLKSAGPATCLIACVSKNWTPNIKNYTIIGEFVKVLT